MTARRGPTRRATLKAGATLPIVAALAPFDALAQGAGELGRIVFHNRERTEARPALGTAGFAAPPGALPAGSSIELRLDGRPVPTQLDRFNAWPDGSLRFGVISAVLPRLAPGASATASAVATRAADAQPGITAEALLAYLEQAGGAPRLDWVDRDHGAFSTEAAAALKAPAGWNATRPALAGRWLNGPLCTEWVCSAPLVGERGQHPSLRAWFHCRAWREKADGGIAGARVQVVIDNSLGPTRIETRDATGDAVISRGGKPVWRRAGRSLPGMRWDSSEGKRLANISDATLLSADAPAFEADDRYKLVEIDGTMVHLLEIRGPREAIGRIVWSENLLVHDGERDGAGPLSVSPWRSHDGKVHLQLSRRVRIAGKEDAGRSFTVKGSDAKGASIREIVTLGANGIGQGRQNFATVDEVSADSPLRGLVNVGTAGLPAERPAAPPRLWGMSMVAHTRWPITVSYGGVVQATPDAATLVRARVVPHYDSKLRSKDHDRFVNRMHTAIAAQTDSSGQLAPNSRNPEGPGYACANIVMSGAQPGGRSDLAVVPGQQVAWLMQPENLKALDVMLAAGQAFHQWPWQFRDRATGLCVDPAAHPSFTNHVNARHELKPPHFPNRYNSMGQMTTDPEHWMEFSYLPFLATGDLAHYETLFQSAFGAWVWHPGSWPDAASSGYRRALVTINARAVAWVVRSLGHVRACGPDTLLDAGVTAPRELIDRIYTQQQHWMKTWFVDGPDRMGEFPKDKGFCIPIDGRSPGFSHAPWMQNYLSAVLGHLNELGTLNDNGSALFAWYKGYSVALADPAQTHPAAAARAYYWPARKPDGTPLRSMAEIYRFMAEGHWPEPARENFQHILPAVTLAIDRGARVGAVIEASIQVSAARRNRGTVGKEFVGRQIFTMADKGLGTITAVEDLGEGRGNRLKLRIDQPFGAAEYKENKWRLQLPAPGPARYITLDPTHSVGHYPYWLMGALAVLANAGVQGAAQRWQELHKMAQNSKADFTEAAAHLCGWAISPR